MSSLERMVNVLLSSCLVLAVGHVACPAGCGECRNSMCTQLTDVSCEVGCSAGSPTSGGGSSSSSCPATPCDRDDPSSFPGGCDQNVFGQMCASNGNGLPCSSKPCPIYLELNNQYDQCSSKFYPTSALVCPTTPEGQCPFAKNRGSDGYPEIFKDALTPNFLDTTCEAACSCNVVGENGLYVGPPNGCKTVGQEAGATETCCLCFGKSAFIKSDAVKHALLANAQLRVDAGLTDTDQFPFTTSNQFTQCHQYQTLENPNAPSSCANIDASRLFSTVAGNAYAALAAPAAACQPDPHCSTQGSQCMCCYNGGCEIDQQCKCLSAAVALDSEPVAQSNLTGLLAAADEVEADTHCSITPNGQCMCCYNGGCDVDMTQAKCGRAPAPAPACQPDPRCSIQNGQCMCCYNGGCEIDQQCKCLSAVVALDSEPVAQSNLTGSLAAAIEDENKSSRSHLRR